MKQAEPNSVARKFENLTNIFYLMVGIPLVAFSWVYLNLKTTTPRFFFHNAEMETIFHGIVLGAVIIISALTYRKYKKQILSAREGSGAYSISEKAALFVAVSQQYYFGLTLSKVLVILGLYLSVEEFYIFFYSLFLILFSISRPGPERMMKEMRLNKEEKQALLQVLNNPADSNENDRR